MAARPAQPGERVLDLGSGAGTDWLVAAQMVGENGHVTGIDMTPEMLTKARSAADEMAAANVESGRPAVGCLRCRRSPDGPLPDGPDPACRGQALSN
jgi:tRNA A58 N-methylase Trm61